MKFKFLRFSFSKIRGKRKGFIELLPWEPRIFQLNAASPAGVGRSADEGSVHSKKWSILVVGFVLKPSEMT